MTDTSRKGKLESVKKEIRALLISSQTGVLLYNFTDDYYEVVGVHLDFTDLGFFDLESFLQAIPDVVSIVEGPDGQKILKHVSDERTKHIEKLVEHQKPSGSASKNRTRKARGATPPSSYSLGSVNNGFFQSQSQNYHCKPLNSGRNNNFNNRSPLLSPPPNNHPSLSLGFHNNRRSGFSNNSSNCAVSPSSKKCLSPSSSSFRVRPSPNNSAEMITTTSFRRPSLPNFIRLQIHQTMAPFKEPVSQSLFEAAYKENFGAYLNFEKCGFGSMDELLQSIPDCVKRILQKNGEYCYTLVGNAVSDYRGRTSPFSPKTNSSSPLLHSAFLQPHSPKNSGFQTITPNNVLNTSPHHSKSYASISGGYTLSTEYPHLSNLPSADNKTYRDSCRSPIPVLSPNNLVREEYADDIIDLWIDDFDISVNPKVAQKIEKVMEKHPSGLYASMLCAEYKKMHGQDLDYRDLGYLSVIELVSKLKSVRIVRPTVSGDWLLFDAQKPYAAVQKLVDQIRLLEVNKTSLVKEREKEVRLNISKMLEMLPEGVNLDQFIEIYKKITGDEFQPEDVGFKSLESYILSLASNVVEISYTGNACLTIRSLKTSKLENLTESPAKTHDSPKSKKRVCNSFPLPEDAVGPGVSYRLLDIWTDTQYVEVFVSNIQTPGNFWIQFRGNQHSLALEKLMDDLEALYCSSESNTYQVPDDFLQVGLVAVAVYPEDQNWHRILITSVPNLSYVEVYFVDYGNTCIVPRNNLRLLRRDFLNLPMQAIQARLANVKPIGDKWTTNAQNRMLKLCSNKPLVALVTKVKDHVMSLCLIDTSITNVDIHINDLLVKEEYGCFSPDEKGQTKISSSSTADSTSYSNSENPAFTCSSVLKSPTHKIQLQQFQQGISKLKTQEEKDLVSKHVTDNPNPNPKLPVNRPTSIQRPSPSASPTFDTMNNVKQNQNPKLNNLTLNSSHNFQRHENIPRPTSISTSCVNQMKIPEKSTLANNSFIFQTTSANNHVPKIDYPISKGNDLKPFVKKVRLTDEYAVHVFNFNDTACISSCDLSAFLWKIDIIRTMLRTVNLGISKVIICEEDYSELFSELKRINFSGLWDGEERKDWVTLFRLEENQRDIPKDSPFKTLSPFIDEYRLLKIGGRIRKVEIGNEEKYPIIIPGIHHIATLLVRHYHNQTITKCAFSPKGLSVQENSGLSAEKGVVPVVLETFNHPSAELKMAVQIAIRSFDPNDKFWTGKGEESATDNTPLSALPICKPTSPKPIPKSISQRQSPTLYNEQYGLSSSSSPPQFFFGKGSPSQRTELKTSSSESSPRSRRPSTVTLEDIKTINANLTHLHKLRQCILNKMEKGNCPYDSYVSTLENVESKLQKLNALLIKASPTVESKDPPGQGRLLSPYQQNSCNSRSTPSPAGSLGFSPRDTRSTFQSPSPSPLPDTSKVHEVDHTDDPEAKKFCKLYVGSLKLNTTEDMVQNYFSKFGEVVNCIVMRNQFTRESRGFAYIIYKTLEMVDIVQKNRPHYLDKKELVTRRAIPAQLVNKCRTSQTKIFIGGVKPETTEDQIWEVFSHFGVIRKLQRILDKQTSFKRGFCFITYDDYDSVDQCVLRQKIYLDGAYVEIKIAVPKDKEN